MRRRQRTIRAHRIDAPQVDALRVDLKLKGDTYLRVERASGTHVRLRFITDTDALDVAPLKPIELRGNDLHTALHALGFLTYNESSD